MLMESRIKKWYVCFLDGVKKYIKIDCIVVLKIMVLNVK